MKYLFCRKLQQKSSQPKARAKGTDIFSKQIIGLFSNDADVITTLSKHRFYVKHFLEEVFETEKEARAFAANENIKGTVIIDRSKHIYRDWAPIIEKRGAFNPLMDPFKMEVNKQVEYSENMCAKSLDIMKKCAHISIDPDWTIEEINALADKIKEAVK